MIYNYIPIFTTGNVGEPSIKVKQHKIVKPVFVSTYTGKILPNHPTYETPTDDPTGKNITYHGAIFIGKNIYMCH